MSNIIRLIGLLLIGASLVGILCACKTDTPPEPGQTETKAESTTGSKDPAPPEDLHAIDVLGERDLTGQTITFFARVGGNMWDIASLDAEEYLADTINDAVYDRNEALYGQFGFDVEIIESGATSYSQRVENQILSGTNEFDVLTACGYDMAELAAKAVLRDVTQIDSMRLDQSWWNTTLNEQLSIANALFYFTGDLICEDNMAVRCVFFNKSLADAVNESPDALYTMAREGMWTFEQLFRIAADAYVDMDNVTGKSDGDRFGLMGQTAVAAYVFMTAAGVQITSKNSSDEPVLNSSFNYDVLDAIAAYLVQDGVLIAEDVLTPYKNGRVLFMTEVLGTVIKIRDWDIKSGILPMPKYQESQESYYHFADGNCLNLLALPTGNNSRLNDITFIMNAMCVESANTLNPAFYDTCLRGRYSYDPESAEMLDIIFDSYYIENANLYKRSWKSGDSNIQDDIMKAIAAGESVSTVIASYSQGLPAQIRNTISRLRDIALAQRT